MVKRVQQVNNHGVSKHYGLFSWQQCEFCCQEFRRENGYKWSPRGYFYRYACNTCCASISHCNDQIDYKRKSETALMTGEVPPSPPMRTYNNQR